MVKTVRKANKKMNRRQWIEGKLYKKNFAEYLRMEIGIVLANFL